METAQNSLFISPACGRLSNRIALFTPEMSVPAVCAAALLSPSWPELGARLRAGVRCHREPRTPQVRGRGVPGLLLPRWQRWLVTARKMTHSMGLQSFHVPCGTENLQKDKSENDSHRELNNCAKQCDSENVSTVSLRQSRLKTSMKRNWTYTHGR